jgi:peptide/nickel transport system substrate-binding protein
MYQVSRRRFLQVSVGAGTALVAGCAPVAPQPTAPPAANSLKRGGVITIGVTREVADLSDGVRNYSRAVFNTLTRLDMQGNISGELAESWKLDGPTNYLFSLREGITFHDGTAWDAAAMKDNFDRVMDPANKSLWLSELANISSVEVIDQYTARVTLKASDASFPARMSGKSAIMQSPTATKKPDANLHPVGTGPFEFVEWVKDDHITFKRNASNWEKDAQGGTLPYLDSLTFKPIPDATVRLTALRAGQLDMVDSILPSDLDKVRTDSDLAMVSGPGANEVMWLNCVKPPFDNKFLRQALAWATDREAMQKAIFFDTGQPATALTNLDHWSYNAAGPFYAHDPAKAKAALAAGGQPDGFEFTAVVDNATLNLQVAQALKGSLAEVGIQMSIDAVETTVNTARRLSGDFQGATSYLPPVADPDENLFALLRTGAAVNRGRYSNPTLDDLLDRGRATTDQQQRQQIYYQVQDLLFDETPILLIHRDADIKVMNTRVQGFAPSFDTYMVVQNTWLNA